ncbi:MAG: hypothetical protein LUF90_03645 [Rikenellaceae bacterium]|nr:hypothetical protein [Rikenellaceae bacterium]
MRKLLFIFSPVLLALVIISCGTQTRVVSTWRTPHISVTAMSKVLVLGMMEDREAKDYIEKTMVRDMAAEGITAMTGTSEFGPRGFGNLTQEKVNKKLTDEGYSSIIIVCLTDKDKQINYTPGSAYYSPYGPAYYGYYGRYRSTYDNIYSPGYFTTSTTYVLDADLYSLPDDKLIYSAQTRSYDPANSRDLAQSFSEEIINDLAKNGIIKK